MIFNWAQIRLYAVDYSLSYRCLLMAAIIPGNLNEPVTFLCYCYEKLYEILCLILPSSWGNYFLICSGLIKENDCFLSQQYFSSCLWLISLVCCWHFNHSNRVFHRALFQTFLIFVVLPELSSVFAWIIVFVLSLSNLFSLEHNTLLRTRTRCWSELCGGGFVGVTVCCKSKKSISLYWCLRKKDSLQCRQHTDAIKMMELTEQIGYANQWQLWASCVLSIAFAPPELNGHTIKWATLSRE